MAGPSNGSSPDRPGIWLSHQLAAPAGFVPAWLKASEAETLGLFSGRRRSEYLTSRWLIRQAIHRYSGAGLVDCVPVCGRPVATEAPAGLHLSLSHSHGLTACAVATGPIGLDLEPADRRTDWARVAKRWFTPVEQAWLFQDNDPSAFLKVWTLKEAWLKATGRGIAGNLQTLEVRRGFELYGDQADQTWQASCFYVEGFLLTLVHPADRWPDAALWPRVQLLEPPPEDFSLTPGHDLDTHWEPLFQRGVRGHSLNRPSHHD
ncbi:MAG: 4'-phosphopantetheinyl transferase superfamily protein [Pseudomonadota bacterium]|nr:4'-phosphopantetheinyl transferase superfamily protein [Pseudomonadota bacterium]